MPTKQDYLNQARTAIEEAKKIWEGNPDAAAIESAEKYMKEAESFKASASQLQKLELMSADMGDLIVPDGGAGTSKGQQPGLPAPSSAFSTFGDFVQATVDNWQTKGTVKHAALKPWRDRNEDEADLRGVSKSMSGAVGSAGGFLIPVENYAQLMAVAAPIALIRKYATILRMARRQITIPMVDQTGTTAGVPGFFGGVQVYWKEEAGQKDITDVKFKQTTLTAHKLIAYTEVSDELLEDANTSLADFLAGPMGFPGAIAHKEDYSFLRGSGVGEPLGIVSAPATVSISARATASSIEYADIVKMLVAFMGQSPRWIASKSAMGKLLLMAGPTATNYAGAFLWGDTARGVPNTLMGYPIEFTDKLPAVGVKGDLMLVDASYYLIGDRQATTFEATNTYKFRTDETAFRAVHRVDGRPWLTAPIRHVGDASDVSPFVVIPSNP